MSFPFRRSDLAWPDDLGFSAEQQRRLCSLFADKMIGGGAAAYTVANSLRLNAGATACLTRTPGAAGNRKTFTLAAWVKRGGLGASQYLFHARTGSGSSASVYFNSSDKLVCQFYNSGSGTNYLHLITTAVYRDPTAHMHVVAAVDTTQATAANRIKLYVNGAQVTAFDTATYDSSSLNWDTQWNSTDPHAIGKYTGGSGSSDYLDGYLAEFHSVDGQALTPADFGATNADGLWVPKAYAGTYGANGFYLNFINGAALGEDQAGSNDWTLNNIASADQCLDTPSNNFATLNVLDVLGSGGSVKNAGLTLDMTSGDHITATATQYFSSGLFYAEGKVLSPQNNAGVGVYLDTNARQQTSTSYVPGYNADGASYRCNGYMIKYGSADGSWGATLTTNDTFMIAVDATNGAVYFGKNGTWQNGGDPTSGAARTGAAHTWSGGAKTCAIAVLHWDNGSSGSIRMNFGQFAFAYTPPSGFKSLCTANLPSAAVSTSGSFVGNASADGPCIWTNGDLATLTINGNAVTWGTHADKIAGGFKIRTSSSSYNAGGTNNWTATAGNRFVGATGTPNTAR